MSAPAKVLLFCVAILVVVCVTVMYRYQMPPFRPAAEGVATADTSTAGVRLDQVSAKGETLGPGQKLYEQYCVLCHGATGTGDTPAGKAMGATNLAAEVFKANTKNLPPKEYILQVIQEGVPGTAMVSFKGQIPEKSDQTALADYVVSLKK